MRLAALALATLLAHVPVAGAQRSPPWARATSARTLEAALARGVSVIANLPADVDADGTADALLQLERDDPSDRALAVARRGPRGWRVQLAYEHARSEAIAWTGAISIDGRHGLVATGCRGSPCATVLHVFVVGAREVEAAGTTVGEPGETLSVTPADATTVVASDRGRMRWIGLHPTSHRLWLGPWVTSPADALATRAIALGGSSSGSRLALSTDRVAAFWFIDPTHTLGLRTFARDGTPEGPAIDTGLRTGAPIHAAPSGEGFAITTRRDVVTGGDDERWCGHSVLSLVRWTRAGGAAPAGTIELASVCEDDALSVASGAWLGVAIDASGIRWVGPDATAFGAIAAPTPSPRLLGAGPGGFLVALGERVVEVSTSGAVSPVEPFTGASPRTCVGTERAWACELAIERFAGPRLAIRPRGARGLPATTLAVDFTSLEALPGDRLALYRLNTYDGGGHVAVFHVLDLATGRVGPVIDLGRGFLEGVVADAGAIYATCGERMHRIPWSLVLPDAPE